MPHDTAIDPANDVRWWGRAVLWYTGRVALFEHFISRMAGSPN